MTKHEEVRPSGLPHGVGYPVVGETTYGLGKYLVEQGKLRDEAAFARIRNGALSIVKQCRRFDGSTGRRTGLVVGYVQSGKTMSMTTVSALARDNGCRIIIVLAGVTTNLLRQNAERFRTDLRGASAGHPDAWRIVNSEDGLGSTDVQALKRAVDEWRDSRVDEEDQRTFLFMVLKQHRHLERLCDLLRQVDLRGVPALVLDDEADQAGLNTAADTDEASRTYSRIDGVRAQLDSHTYLQYTATPQAPLLIALDDLLSPEFAELVEPGEGYTGGQAFFGQSAIRGIVRTIPQDDLFDAGDPPEAPPASLVEAMRLFFVGCAAAAVRGQPSLRSMLIHPSQRNADHARCFDWVSEIVGRWASALRSTDEDERADVLEEFRDAYRDLATTDEELPAFESLVDKLRLSLSRVSLSEVNSRGEDVEVDWTNAQDHILIGGEKLNRGFTVEGLTVTYMPRGTGGWNADTIQQRARFFGYKSKYLSLCRLFLHPDVRRAYESYVTHEEHVRAQLAEHRGKPLREWRRAFFLNAKMRPTRQNVLRDPYYRISAGKPWFQQRYPHVDAVAVESNCIRIRELEESLSFEPFALDTRHRATETPLRKLYEDVLLAYRVRGDDVPAWYGTLVTIADVIESDPEAVCLVVKMQGPRERSLEGGAVKLHQGRSSAGAERYAGDNKMVDAAAVTIQIHWINVKGDGPQGVPAIAVHIPPALRREDVGVQVTEHG